MLKPKIKRKISGTTGINKGTNFKNVCIWAGFMWLNTG